MDTKISENRMGERGNRGCSSGVDIQCQAALTTHGDIKPSRDRADYGTWRCCLANTCSSSRVQVSIARTWLFLSKGTWQSRLLRGSRGLVSDWQQSSGLRIRNR